MELNIWEDKLELNKLEEMQTKVETEEEMQVEETPLQAQLLYKLLLFMLEVYLTLQLWNQSKDSSLQSEKSNQLELSPIDKPETQEDSVMLSFSTSKLPKKPTQN